MINKIGKGELKKNLVLKICTLITEGGKIKKTPIKPYNIHIYFWYNTTYK
jgi:hypothetical protein